MAEPLSNSACHRSVPESYTLPLHKRPVTSNPVEVVAAAAIPVVDLGGADHGEIVEHVFNAGREFGFFQVINHGVSGEVMAKMMSAAQGFFMLPTEDKMAYYSTDRTKIPRFHTSVGNANEKVLYWRACLKLGCHPFDQFMHTWPDKPPTLRPALEAYTTAVRALALRLLRLTAAGLAGIIDDEGYFDGELSDGPVLMNVNHYVPCPDPSLTLGLAPHCDPNLVTVLMASGAAGLQALVHGEWVDVEHLPGAFVVNFGHQMETVTNGRVRSGEHRVVNNASAERTSVATFIMPEMGCTVAPAPELVADGEAPLYRPYTYEEFVAVYAAETGDRDAVLAHFISS